MPSSHHECGRTFGDVRVDKPTTRTTLSGSAVVPDVTAATLRKVMAEQVDLANSDLHTDEAKAYRSIGPEFRSHEAIVHSRGEYARGNVSTNRAEGYFAQLKRSIDGTHHHVSREHLHRYLGEFDFRYSTCEQTDNERMALLLSRVGGRRLPYQQAGCASTA